MRYPNLPGLPPRGGSSPREPQPAGTVPHAVLIGGGVGLYLTTLWLGVAVIGDTILRSALMGALIVAIAAVGYIFTHLPGSDRG